MELVFSVWKCVLIMKLALLPPQMATVKTEGLLGAFSLSILWLPWIHYISRWLVRETKYRKAVSRNKATGGLIS